MRPTTVELDGVLYCHATPQSDMPILTEASPQERFDEALDGVDARLVVAGHTHMQFTRARFVNAGSVGMPYEGEVARVLGARRRRRRVPQDAVRRRARDRGDPRFRLAGSRGVRRGEPPRVSVARRDDRVLRVACLSASTSAASASARHQGRVLRRAWERGPGALCRRRDAVRRRRAGRGRRVEARGRPAGDPARPRAARGAALEVDSATLPDAGPDEYYVFQLVGLDVERGRRSRSAACEDVEPGAANDVLELDSGLLLPLVGACVREIDLNAGTIVVEPGFDEAD